MTNKHRHTGSHPLQQGSRGRHDRTFLVSVAVLFCFLCFYPFWADGYSLSIIRDILIFSIFALSLDFFWGQTGLLSFGHSAFFGAGAYIMALLTYLWNVNSLAALALAMVMSAAVALLIGYFLIYAGVRREYFAIVTLALALIGQQVVLSFSSVTGGDAGLLGIPTLSIGVGDFSYEFASDISLYFLSLGLATVILMGLWWAVRSHFGMVLRSIQSNEQRAQTLGYMRGVAISDGHFSTLIEG